MEKDFPALNIFIDKGNLYLPDDPFIMQRFNNE